MKCNEISKKAPRFFSCVGDHLKQLYKAEVKKDGTIVLHEAGVQDTDEFIQSFRQSTELRTLIARFNAGEVGVFDQVPTFEGDFTDFPMSLQQAFDILEYAKNAFDQVDPDSRKQYDNNFVKWISDYGSPEFLKSCGVQLPAEDLPMPSSDVKEGEKE